ncbi:MAG: hypothetical protein V7752_11810 [Halopseudomonas sp.]
MARRWVWVNLLCLLSSSAVAGLYSRDLACQQQVSPRAVELCHALQDALAWSWTGHAIISPGFRVDTERVRDLYCRLPVTATDTPALVEIALSATDASDKANVQLYSGTLSLLSMLGDKALTRFPSRSDLADDARRDSASYLREQIVQAVAESSSSIFNPSHRYYILLNGCPEPR